MAIVTQWLFLGMACARTQTATPSSAEKGKGVLFNWERTVLLAERFEPVEFVVPLPAYSVHVASDIARAASLLRELWDKPTFDCDLSGTTQYKDTRTEEIVAEVTSAHEAALTETRGHTEEMQRMLTSTADPQSQSRRRRFVPALAAGIVASTVLGLGLGVGISESCFLHGAFGTCSKKQIRASRRDIDTALAQIHAQGERWTEVVNEVNEKFYLVATEMEQLNKIQHQIQTQQDEFWNATENAPGAGAVTEAVAPAAAERGVSVRSGEPRRSSSDTSSRSAFNGGSVSRGRVWRSRIPVTSACSAVVWRDIVLCLVMDCESNGIRVSPHHRHLTQ